MIEQQFEKPPEEEEYSFADPESILPYNSRRELNKLLKKEEGLDPEEQERLEKLLERKDIYDAAIKMSSTERRIKDLQRMQMDLTINGETWGPAKAKELEKLSEEKEKISPLEIEDMRSELQELNKKQTDGKNWTIADAKRQAYLNEKLRDFL